MGWLVGWVCVMVGGQRAMEETDTVELGNLNTLVQGNYLVILQHLHFLRLAQHVQDLVRGTVQHDVVLARRLDLLEQRPIVGLRAQLTHRNRKVLWPVDQQNVL